MSFWLSLMPCKTLRAQEHLRLKCSSQQHKSFLHWAQKHPRSAGTDWLRGCGNVLTVGEVLRAAPACPVQPECPSVILRAPMVRHPFQLPMLRHTFQHLSGLPGHCQCPLHEYSPHHSHKCRLHHVHVQLFRYWHTKQPSGGGGAFATASGAAAGAAASAVCC